MRWLVDRRARRLPQNADLDDTQFAARSDRGAGVLAGIAEHIDHQVGGAVDDLGLVGEARRAGDEAGQLDGGGDHVRPLHRAEALQRLGDTRDLAGHGDREGARLLLAEAVLHAVRVAGLPLILYQGQRNQVLAVLIWNMWTDGEIGNVGALATMLILVLLTVTLLLRAVGFRRHGI